MQVDLSTLHTALVTGASSGIGRSFAEELARRGLNLVLVARSRPQLEALAEVLRQEHAVLVEVLAADLTDPDGLARVRQRLVEPDRPIDMLVNNAGDSIAHDLVEVDVDRLRAHVGLNVVAVLALTRAALPSMTARGRGAVVNVASVNAFVAIGGPAAVYGAGKLWVTVLSRSLARELRGSGVHVLALCPGLTSTEFGERNSLRSDDAGHRRFAARSWNSHDVVHAALQDLGRGRTVSIPGLRFRLTARLGRLMPYRPLSAVPALLRQRRAAPQTDEFVRALIVNADTDLGGAVARSLMRQHTDVVLVGSREGRISELQASLGLTTDGRPAETMLANLADRGDRDSVCARIGDQGRPIDLVVLGPAHPGADRPFLDIPFEELQSELLAGPPAALEVVRAALSVMVAAGAGRVVVLGASGGGSMAAAAEAFMISLTRATAVSLLGSGVTMTAVVGNCSDRAGESRTATRVAASAGSGQVIVTLARPTLGDVAARVASGST